MNLAAKYNRTELIRDGEIQAWKGTERSTGEAVVLYLYTGEVSGGQPLSEYARASLVQSLGAGETQLDGGVFGLSPCMVARAAGAGVSAAPSAKAPAPPVFSAPPPAAAQPAAAVPEPQAASIPPASTEGGHGEFTAMFGAAMAEPVAAPEAAPSAPAPSAPVPVAAEQKQAPAAETMGEFTRLFRAADAAPSAASPDSKATPLASTPAADSGPAKPAAPPHPGVFTSLYMAANAEEAVTAEPATPPAPAAPPQPGVFTNLYMAVSPGSAMEGTSAGTSPDGKAAEPVAEAPAIGEFTSLFMAAKTETAASAADSHAAAPAAASSAPVEASAPATSASPHTAGETPSAPQDAPGEFTMAFQSASVPPAPATAGDALEFRAPEPPSREGAPPAESFDETAELVLESRSPSADPSPEFALADATMMSPAAEATPAGDAPGEFTRLFQAAPEGEVLSHSAERQPVESANAAAAFPEFKAEENAVVAEGGSGREAAEGREASDSDAERFSSASPAKKPIRFVAAEKPASEEPGKPARSPLQSGSFSQTYVSTGEMPVMREEMLGAPLAAPTSAAPPAPPAGGDAPGEFTMLFASPGGAAAPPASAPETPAAPAAPSTTTVPPAAAATPAPTEAVKPAAEGQGPGEFTKFFQPGDVDKIKQEVAAMAKPSASAAGQEKPAAEQPVGEFTRMFSAAEIASRTEKPKDPGVFTSLYLAADSSQPNAAAPATPSAPPPFTAPAPADAGGSFTSMFRAAEAGSLPASPVPASQDVFPPPASGGGFDSPQAPAGNEEPSFTRYFQAGDLSASPVTPQHQEVAAPSPDLPAYSSGYSKGATSFFQAVPEAAAPAAPVEQGPGEYTRMISGDEVKQAMVGPGGQPGPAPAGGAVGGGMSVPLGVPMTAPSVSGPYVQGPRMTGPQMSGPQISSSGISAPHFQGPQMSGPQMSGPQVHAPHVGTPHLQTPHLQVQVPPVQAGGGAPVAPGQQAPAAGGGASKIIIVATVLVTVIAVVLVLMVAYFMLKG